ncbi:hypothetical protein L6164_027658 [Bauhinia variegata]|uniref:Uncharacterized protein n=1 Tax=Bauhinia variegata TaxID=167791 RepID=A0ACB9LVD2_BAUVA|nr:hypothetical protein L6164_027658 [Bauhinia variegata]
MWYVLFKNIRHKVLFQEGLVFLSACFANSLQSSYPLPSRSTHSEANNEKVQGERSEACLNKFPFFAQAFDFVISYSIKG